MQFPDFPSYRMISTALREAFAVLAAIAAFAFISCLKDDGTGPAGTEVENEIKGFLYTENGRPAAGATVRLIPVNYLPRENLPKTGRAADSIHYAIADSKGRYAFDSIPRGEYNLLGNLDGLWSFEDSVIVASRGDTLPTDTLKAAGSISGVVALQPNHDPSTTVIQVLGTYVFANVDENGLFRIPSLAEGRYSIKVSTSLPEYTDLYTGFSVRAGMTDSLSDTLRLRFSGIPVVTGVRAVRYDTLNGIVTLAWKSSGYRNLLGYTVYRDPAGTLFPSEEPINTTRITDTLFQDWVFPDSREGDSLPRSFEYRVRVMDKDSKLGPIHEIFEITLPPPSLVRTVIRFDPPANDGYASTNDTVRVIGNFVNRGRTLTHLSWSFTGARDSIRQRAFSIHEGADTLAISWDSPGTRWITLSLTDEGGVTQADSIRVDIVQDPPVALPGADSTVFIGDSVVLRGGARDGFGRIVKWEWDPGSTGDWKNAPDGVLAIKAPAGPVTEFPCILRVTDDDGNVSTGIRRLRISPSRIRASPPFPFREAKAVVLGGSIYVLDNLSKRMFEYIPAADSWKDKSPRVATRADFSVASLDGGLYLLGGNDTAVERYDPAQDKWSFRKGTNSSHGSIGLHAIEGKLQVLGEYTSETYDGGLDTWTIRTYPHFSKNIRVNAPTFRFGNKFIMISPRMGGYTWSGIPYTGPQFTHIYRAEEFPIGVDTALTDHGIRQTNCQTSSLIGVDGVVYAVGGVGANSAACAEVITFDSRTNTWDREPDLRVPRIFAAVAHFGGSLFIFGGVNAENSTEEYVLMKR